MAESVLVASTAHKLEQFLLLSKSAKGAGCAKLINDALAAPGVYVFGELLEMQNVKELSALPDFEPHYRLLSIFAYGTYQDYKENAATLPPLTPTQVKKLKHLSLVTLSERTRSLNYSSLQTYLDMPNVRELEDLIIDAIYNDVIKGKLDQKKEALEVEYAMGRDLRPNQSTLLLSVLSNWIATSEGLLTALDNKMNSINKEGREYMNEREEWDKKVDVMKSELKAAGPPKRGDEFDGFKFDGGVDRDRGRGGDYGGMDFMPEESGRRATGKRYV
ncbi:hypothetical protein SmJEL517_g04532 [Synchytrium microbalum]|uniref:PCI domain-containing protein n=1 Tax=Synchytrium microbalum TaxID=1806994 RepID=A0A507BZ42_9FUNG|nr:uncharacterized protein SmJEL517_g04532 [Synchytrium microbalum]TPX32378.1 hypothetical protein SmJEL517_g04532 [Synchytrium microbalum]